MDAHAEELLKQVADERRTLFFGKYRGTVIEALTGNDLGKLKVSVPAVLADQPAIAWPCVPFAGPSHGFVSIPEKGDGVWIEFEAGNPSQPIWVGCWWGAGDMPSQADVKARAWVTTGGICIVMDDANNKLSLQHPGGSSITLDSDGITLEIDSIAIKLNASGITIQGNTQVSA